MTARHRAVALGALATALVACSAPAEPDGSGAPSPLPARPFELRLDDLDPCSVFTAMQIDQLGFGPGRFSPADESSPRSCQWIRSSEEGFHGYLVGVDTAAGAEVVLGNPRSVVVSGVAGFPAIETQNPQAPAESQCILVLDVAPDQFLQVNFDYNGSMPMTRERACAEARTAAELAMQTLIARHHHG